MTLRVPLNQVTPDPRQPRKYFRGSALSALATSLKKAGQRQPITVRKREPGSNPPYEIIDGERRWRAAKLAGLATVRIEIEERELASHAEQHLLSLASNFIREGHTHMEVSEALQYQVDAAIAAGQDRRQAIQALTEALGKSETWVYQYLQIQQLCAELQERMHPDTPDEKRLRFAEAVVLCTLPVAQQRAIYRALLSYPPGARLQQAKRLVAQATDTPIQRRSNNVKVSTARFVVRVAAEIERVLDYKQSDFAQGLRAVPEADRKAFRDAVKLLLESIDRAMTAKR
ncbi:ParB/RepB/Spo0J family partition protein [Pseudoxanthomonas jiangsuensis]|uniref:ParB/RepB/Spo0J family partition protein n=1 Tax=Pseudoxanthomonas jiangsuensis TaxID=619688 RepID=UPI001391E1BE|nr:ParB/RepB/Spo0J family partition protein [Pseudoxanthomonas jiangsuensis]